MSPIRSTFPSKKYRPSTTSSSSFTPSGPANAIGAWYRRSLVHHPFALFGLPFLVTIVAGSFFLTPATAVRYERHDRKVRQLNQEEAMGLGKDRRRVDVSEEYYRLAGKDLDGWEQKRVERLEGETDGRV